jgi:hypothetical protein
MTDDFVLYILLRHDMASLDHTGKLVAQGAHAANHAAESIARNEFGPTVMMQFDQWQKQTPQGFGTTIVFGGRNVVRPYADNPCDNVSLTIWDIRSRIEGLQKHGHAGAIITDPSYPIRDGNANHSFSCETCGWAFMEKSRGDLLFADYTLYPATP